jgi:hypothetical protein
MIIGLLFSTFAEGFVAPTTSLLPFPTSAPQRDLRWFLPLVVLGNFVVATIAWTIVWLVMK